MYRYASTCLEGPVSRSRGLGQAGPAEESLRADFDGGWDLLPAEDGVRHALVARIRREIAAGIYDTPEKLELALGRMLDQF